MAKHEHNPGDCIAMFEKLSEYIDGELDAATCRKIEKHLEACIPCRICLITLKKTVGLCREMTPDPVPDNLSQRLREMFENFPPNLPRPSKP